MTPEEMAQLRHDLHQIPEVSGEERLTAAFVTDWLAKHTPDRILTGLGGHGVAAVFDSGQAGPILMIRCELDGLPIPEETDLSYRSRHAGRGHLCGHDGHMAMVLALAEWLSAKPLARGRVVLMFQPAEETGKGAAAVMQDPRFAEIAPDYTFALHNLPGLEIGHVALCNGAANCASRGMRVRLTGRTSHAAAPQDGLSPAATLTRLMPDLDALGQGGVLDTDFALTTVTHARLGEATFGIAPGEAELWVTLRTVTDAAMADLVARAEARVAMVSDEEGLHHAIVYDDVFEACTNAPEAVAHLQTALDRAGVVWSTSDQPQRWSEDFGQFGKTAKSAMFWLGSGLEQPQLHNPDYDFPDAALAVGTRVFQQVLSDILGGNAPI